MAWEQGGLVSFPRLSVIPNPRHVTSTPLSHLENGDNDTTSFPSNDTQTCKYSSLLLVTTYSIRAQQGQDL